MTSRGHSQFEVHRSIPIGVAVLVATIASCFGGSAFAGDRGRGAIQRAEHRQMVAPVSRDAGNVARGTDPAQREYIAPPYISRTGNGVDDVASSPNEMGAQDSRTPGRMSVEERRQLRKAIQDAGRDVYRR